MTDRFCIKSATPVRRATVRAGSAGGFLAQGRRLTAACHPLRQQQRLQLRDSEYSTPFIEPYNPPSNDTRSRQHAFRLPVEFPCRLEPGGVC